MQHNKSGNEEFPVDVTPCAAGIEQAGLEAPGGQGCAGDSCEPAPPDAIAGVAPGFLELVYGMLFEPGKTLHSVAQRPSLTIALALVTALTLAGVLIWLLTVSQAIDQLAGSAAEGFFPAAVKPVLALGAVLMFIWGYIKWLGYSALVSLTAELLGGVGRSRDVAAIAGLALIPTILLIPAQLLNLYLDAALLMLISVPVTDDDIVFRAADFAQLCLHRHAYRSGHIHYPPGQSDIFLQGQLRAIDHHRGKTCPDTLHHLFKTGAVIQVQGHRDTGILRCQFGHINDIVYSGVFNGALAGLHDYRGVLSLGRSHNCLDNLHIVTIKCSHCIIACFRALQQITNRDKRQSIYLLYYF
jgi:hypothetical protein